MTKGLDFAMTQWTLNLTNTFTPSELKTIDFNQIKMSEQWLRKWMKQLL